MKDIKDKLKILWFPFLLISVAFILAYSLLHFLYIKLNLSFLKEDIINFWLPIALPWIPVLIWLRPRIKALSFKKDNTSFGYHFIVVLAIAFPTIVTQEYLATATGKLTKLATIGQFEQSEATKYYTIKKYYLDTARVGVGHTARVSGKHNQDLGLFVYVVIPIFNSAVDTANASTHYFIGRRYNRRISNRLSTEEKEEKYASFKKECYQEFQTTHFENFVYLENMGNTEDHDEFILAAKRGPLYSDKEPIIFTAYNQPFEMRNGGKLGWIFKSFGIGAVVWFIFLLFPKFDKARFAKLKDAPKKDDSYKELLELIIPKRRFFITPILMHLNILIWVILVMAGYGVMSFKTIDLLHWGANYRPKTIHGEWWRLLTSIFLHGGLMHVVANMGGLLLVGLILEPVLGKIRFGVIYLVSGIIASLASIWWHPATVGVGASGAIFGMYGVCVALILLKVFPAGVNKVLIVFSLVFIGYNLLMGLAGGVDNAAHIGGLITGFIAGLIISTSLKKEDFYNVKRQLA